MDEGIEPIAIVGLGARLPGASTVEEFWNNQRDGVESVSWFSEADLLAAGVDPATIADPDYVPAAAVIDDADFFDAEFFGYSPREAEIMDPQHRVFLECAWEALEDSGHAPASFSGAVGVFAGCFMNKYLPVNLYSNARFLTSSAAPFARLHNDKDFLATRVAYLFDLRGPALTVQTACSTSLVATHLACQSLLGYECDLALAGGVCLNVPLNAGYPVVHGGMLTPEGRCRPFDARAQGTVPGFGAAILVLRRLADAVADRDQIRAIIVSTALNNDGAAKAGFMAPSVDAQAEVILAALSLAGVDPDTIGYVEAHGTGTELGDPIEVAALTRAFRAHTHRRGFCALGSVKANIGHLDAAAGAAGLMRAALALQHRQLPPSINYDTPNPRLDLDSSPFYIPTQAAPWPSMGSPRRAGVSSLGVGGTNAHAVLEEAPERRPAGPARSWHLLLLSARSRSALSAAAGRLADHLTGHPELSLADVGFTLAAGRRAFDVRRFVVVADGDSAAAALRSDRPPPAQIEPGRRHVVVFTFPGGGTQYPDMALDIYNSEGSFRDDVDRCAEILHPRLGYDLRSFLFPSRYGPGADREHVPSVLSSIFVIEYALAKLWMSWGLAPVAMIGHSLGEYVAACLSGVFSLPDALDLTVARGELFAQMPPGRMLSVQLSEAALRPHLGQRISVAAVNTPGITLVSGPADDIARLAAQLTDRQIEHRMVHINVASHSWMVEPYLAGFTETVAAYRLSPPQIPFISGVSGTWIEPAAATDAGYWARHLREPVRFADGLRTITEQPGRLLLEVGPGNALTSLAGAQRIVPAPVAVSSLPHPQRREPDLSHLMSALGRLWQAGLTIDWSAFYADSQPNRVSLPSYPFQRRRFWVHAGHERLQPAGGDPNAALTLDRPPTDAGSFAGGAPQRAWVRLAGWRRTLPPPAPAPGAGVWLITDDGTRLADEMAAQAQGLGRTVIRARPGRGYRRDGAERVTLDPTCREQWDRLFDELGQQGRPATHLVRLWRIGDCADLAPLSEALGEVKVRPQVVAVVVAESVAPVTAMAEAISRHGIGCSCVLIDSAASATVRVLAEVDAAASVPRLISYAGGTRLERAYEHAELDISTPDMPVLATPPGGSYLFASGLHGGNDTLAAEFVSATGASLIVVEPVSFPPREAWTDWLAVHGDDDPVGLEITRLTRLSATGAGLAVVRLDEGAEDSIAAQASQAGGLRATIVGNPLGAPPPAPRSHPLSHPRNHGGRLESEPAFGLSLAQRLVARLTPRFVLLQASAAALRGELGTAAGLAAHTLVAHADRAGEATVWLGVGWDDWERGGAAPAGRAVRILDRLLARGVGGRLVASVASATRSGMPEGHELRGAGRGEHDSGASRPRSDREGRLTDIWQELLGVDRVGVEEDFFAIGGTSLMISPMLRRVRQLTAAPITVRDIFEAPTIGLLAALIEDREDARTAGAGPAPLDLAAEVALDPAIRVDGLPGPVAGARAVLLTGVTGYLGAYLCADLLERGRADVYCLVRAADATEAGERIRRRLQAAGLPTDDLHRVVPILGDLAQARLGLPEHGFAELAERIDAIYHCGAFVNFVRPYRTLKQTNVLGTQEVLRLACTTRLKPVHHISTLATLAGRFVGGADEVYEDDPLPPPIGHDTGYSQSKWVAEGVAMLARGRGVPVSIYRPGVILGDSRTGVSNHEDYLTKMIQSCVELGSAPLREYPLVVGTVDFVSAAIVEISQQPVHLGGTFHVVDPDPLPWNRIFDHIRDFGFPVRSLPSHEWSRELADRVEDDPANALAPLADLLSDVGDRHVPRIDCRNTLDALAGTEVSCPALDEQFHATVLRYLIRSELVAPVEPSTTPAPGAGSSAPKR